MDISDTKETRKDLTKHQRAVIRQQEHAISVAVSHGIDPKKIVKKTRKHDHMMRFNHDLIAECLRLHRLKFFSYRDIACLMNISKDSVIEIVNDRVVPEERTEEQLKRLTGNARYAPEHSFNKVIQEALDYRERVLKINRKLKRLGYAS